jgi:hypothetical protein
MPLDAPGLRLEASVLSWYSYQGTGLFLISRSQKP